MDIKELMAKINKKYGKGSLMHANDMKKGEKRITSGSAFLDWALGGTGDNAGFPLGRIIELYGKESSGKSLICLKAIADAQKKGIGCVYFDCEKSFDRKYATELGVDVKKLILSRENIGEVVIEMMAEMLRSKKIKIIVVDSLASMIPTRELEDDMKDQQMALVARMMSKALRKLTALNSDTLIVFINQLRERPGVMYGNPEYTPGGKALGFYSSIRIAVRRGDWIVTKKEKVGQVVKFRVTKNKTAIPLREGFFKYLYTGEIDKIDELISLGELNGTLKRRGAYYYVGEEGYRGRADLESNLKSDKALLKKVRKIVLGEEKVK